MKPNVQSVLSSFFKTSMDFTSIAPLITPSKKLNPRELARALRISIAAEHDAAHLYELIADASSDERVKKVMQDVADEEKVHAGEFESLLNMIDKENEKLVEEGKEEVKKEIL